VETVGLVQIWRLVTPSPRVFRMNVKVKGLEEGIL